MTSHRSLYAALALAALAAAPAARAQLANGTPGNLVTNGSMNFAFREGGRPVVTGWTFLNLAGNAESWNSFAAQTSPDGGEYLGVQDLATFAPRINVGGITQTLAGLTIGAVYDLTFYSMSNHDGGGLQDWLVTFGGSSRTSLATQPNADNTGNWVQSTMSFTATSATQALTFAAQYLPGSVPEILNLDGVILRQSTVAVSPVPEPETYELLLAGLGAVSFAQRRRMRKG